MLLPLVLVGIVLTPAHPPLLARAAAATSAQQEQTASLRTVDYDPVEACFGQHIAGSAEWTRSYGRFTYRFASEETRAIFDAEPGRYAVQLGGACARMGSLSGAGAPQLYTVHAGRLYFFASDDCRSGFLARPDAHLWTPEPSPTPNADAVRAGRALVARAVQAIGGKEALRQVRSLTLSEQQTQGSGPQAADSTRLLRFDFTGDLDLIRSSGAWTQTIHVRGAGGVLVEDGAVFPLDPSQRLAALRELHGEPLWLLAQRNDPRFRFWGESGPKGEVLACFAGGITTRLELDAEGRVLAVLQRRHDPSLGFTNVRTELGPPGDVAGLKLALERHPTTAGRPVEGLGRSWSVAASNEPLHLAPEPGQR